MLEEELVNQSIRADRTSNIGPNKKKKKEEERNKLFRLDDFEIKLQTFIKVSKSNTLAKRIEDLL